MAAKKVSLLDFARQYEKPSCYACLLPERAEVEGAYKSGVPRKVILKWLWEVQGYGAVSGQDEDGKVTGISSTMIDKHFTGAHHYSKGVES